MPAESYPDEADCWQVTRMTAKQRMLIAMRNGQPDCVPVAPDTSNMIPCRLTGKPFWDIYLYQDPPRWQAYGGRISLTGNLHTTEIMLHGTPDDVRRASKQAIDDAGAGGGFILSTGDQCGRDTPEENIRAMIDVARDYGRY